MSEFLLGAAKAVVTGIAAGGAALAVYLGVSPDLVAIVTVIVTPVLVYITPNVRVGGPQESASAVPVRD